MVDTGSERRVRGREAPKGRRRRERSERRREEEQEEGQRREEGDTRRDEGGGGSDRRGRREVEGERAGRLERGDDGGECQGKRGKNGKLRRTLHLVVFPPILLFTIGVTLVVLIRVFGIPRPSSPSPSSSCIPFVLTIIRRPFVLVPLWKPRTVVEDQTEGVKGGGRGADLSCVSKWWGNVRVEGKGRREEKGEAGGEQGRDAPRVVATL